MAKPRQAQENAPEHIVDKFPELERLIASCDAGTLAIGNITVTVNKREMEERWMVGVDRTSKPRFASTINIALQGEADDKEEKAMKVEHRPTTFKDRNGPDFRSRSERSNGYLAVSVGKKPVADAVEEVNGWKVRTDILGVEEMGLLIALLEAVRDEQKAEKQRQADALTKERNDLRAAANVILQWR